MALQSFTFFLNADNDLPLHKLADVLRSQRCVMDYEELDGACAHLCDDEDEAAEVKAENNDSIYLIECDSEIMDKEEALEALSYALFEGGGLNPDLKIRSIAKAA